MTSKELGSLEDVACGEASTSGGRGDPLAKPSWSTASDRWSRRDVRRFGSGDRQTGRYVDARTPWVSAVWLVRGEPSWSFAEIQPLQPDGRPIRSASTGQCIGLRGPGDRRLRRLAAKNPRPYRRSSLPVGFRLPRNHQHRQRGVWTDLARKLAGRQSFLDSRRRVRVFPASRRGRIGLLSIRSHERRRDDRDHPFGWSGLN